MPAELNIGQANKKSFRLPAEIQTQTSAILGIRGSGKTTTAVVIVEELLEVGAQIAIVDPLDVWWGLKSSRDGKAAGYPVVVMGGEHADLPLSVKDGATIADFIVDERVPVVLSLRHLRKHDQQQVVTDFAEQIYHRKGETRNRVPLLVVIDEASTFVPQNVDGKTARMVGAVEDLVRRGRSSGIGVIAIDQRPASVNKDVLTQLELLIGHQVTSPQDRKALQLWIEAHDTADRGKEFMTSLASLDRGTAWFWSPGWDVFERVAVRNRTTFDSSATPKPGQVRAAPRKLAEIDLPALKQRLAKTIEEAKKNDPKELHRQIAELQKQLATKPAGASREQIKAGLEKREAKWQEHAERFVAKRLRPVEVQMQCLQAGLESAMLSLTDAREYLREALEGLPPPEAPVIGLKKERQIAPPPKPAIRERLQRPDQHASNGDATALPIGERRILTACAQYSDGATREQLTVLTAYKRSSRDTYIQRLRERGYLEAGGSELVATQAGLAALGSDFEPLPTGEALREYWLQRLPAGERLILENLVAAYPQVVSREALSQATGYQRSSRDTYLQRMSSKRLVSFPAPGQVAASDELF